MWTKFANAAGAGRAIVRGGAAALALAAGWLAGAGSLPTAHAQTLADYDYEHLSFQGLGLDVGYLRSGQVRGAPVYGLRLDLGFLGPGVRIVPTIGFWRARLRQGELDALAERVNGLGPLKEQGIEIQGADLAPIDWRDLFLSVDAQLVRSVPEVGLVYGGFGAGVHFLDASGSEIDGTLIEDRLNAVSAGGTLLAGLEMEPLHRTRVFAEGRYTLLRDVRFATLRVGAGIRVGNDPSMSTSGGGGVR